MFNLANKLQTGTAFDLECAAPSDNITYNYNNDWLTPMFRAGALVKLHRRIHELPAPDCDHGMKNSRGLMPLGLKAIKYMMSKGMLIDIDHMSQKAVDDTPYSKPDLAPERAMDDALDLALKYRYPVNSGHNGLRGFRDGRDPHEYETSERQLRAVDYCIIGHLHGMAGVGSAGLDASQWLKMYKHVVAAMGAETDVDIVAAFGTDTNGLAKGMPPRPGSDVHDLYGPDFPMSQTGDKSWNYDVVGVAHYGMLWDFLQDVRSLDGGTDMVNDHFMYGSDYFYHTWKIAEARAAAIRNGTVNVMSGRERSKIKQTCKNRTRPQPILTTVISRVPQGWKKSLKGNRRPPQKEAKNTKQVKSTIRIKSIARYPGLIGIYKKGKSGKGFGGSVKEDCIHFDPKETTVKNVNGRWKIVQGSHWLFDFAGNHPEAVRAHQIITHYGMNKVCYVGRPHPSMTYLLIGDVAPHGAYAGEDCLPFNPRELSVRHEDGQWLIAQGRESLLGFGSERDEARRALRLIKKYHFTRQCFVGRPEPSFSYFRR